MDAAQPGGNHSAEDGEQQGHGEAEQGSDEGREQDAERDGVPAWGAWVRHWYQGNSTRIEWQKFAARVRDMSLCLGQAGGSGEDWALASLRWTADAAVSTWAEMASSRMS